MKRHIYRACLSGKMIIDQRTPLTQHDIQSICGEYHARLVGTRFRERKFYQGLSELHESITVYKFERLSKHETSKD